MPLLKISAAARELGVSKSVLREWDKAGKIETVRSPGGMRLFDIANIAPAAVAKTCARRDRSVVLYARVSSSKQQDDLEQQQQYLRDNLPDKYSKTIQIPVSDIGSGLNFKRPGLLRVLELVKEGRVSAVVVASRDRMARFAFELIEWLCFQYKTALVVLEPDNLAPDAELGKDLMAIVQVYCGRWNGKQRRNANKTNKAQLSQQSEEESSQASDDLRADDSAPEQKDSWRNTE